MIDVFVARQPILDRTGDVAAYELLFRAGPANRFGSSDPERASSQMMHTVLSGFGLDTICRGRTAFVNVGRDVLLGGLYAALPAERTVLEVLETVEPDAAVAEAVAQARAAGYRVALDDFIYRPEFDALLPHADIIKIDFLAHLDRRERAGFVQRFGEDGRRTLLAEKVETHEDWQEAIALGYTLGQGYFFAKPELLRGRELRPNRIAQLRFLAEVSRPELDFEKLEAVILQDVAISVRLLRYLNSAGFGWKYEVTSIRQALNLLGESGFRKWAALTAVVSIADTKTPALLTMALVRARGCELAGERLGLEGAGTNLFLAGLLSVLDAVTDQPLQEAVDGLPLARPVRDALLAGEGPIGRLLTAVRAHERGRWAEAGAALAALGAPDDTIAAVYPDAIGWAQGVTRS